jgi:hypothetical protein
MATGKMAADPYIANNIRGVFSECSGSNEGIK